MASKITTYCDITRQICSQTFRVGFKCGDDSYIMDLNKEGLMLLMSSMMNEIPAENITNILNELVGANWKETLAQNS